MPLKCPISYSLIKSVKNDLLLIIITVVITIAVLFTKPNFAHATLVTYKNFAIFKSTSPLIIIENPIILQQQNQITFICNI
jgi:hypothetical protein